MTGDDVRILIDEARAGEAFEAAVFADVRWLLDRLNEVPGGPATSVLITRDERGLCTAEVTISRTHQL